MSGVVRIGRRDVAVYMSDTLQSEWVLSQALLLVIHSAMFLVMSFRSLSLLISSSI